MNVLTFEEMVTVQMAFNKNVGEKTAAEFTVHLQQAVDGLTENNQAFAHEYRRSLEENYALRTAYAVACAIMRSQPVGIAPRLVQAWREAVLKVEAVTK